MLGGSSKGDLRGRKEQGRCAPSRDLLVLISVHLLEHVTHLLQDGIVGRRVQVDQRRRPVVCGARAVLESAGRAGSERDGGRGGRVCAAGGGSWERGRSRELGAHRHRLLAHKEKLQVKEREAAADVTEELWRADSERSRDREYK